jgi:hypothetical protein
MVHACIGNVTKAVRIVGVAGTCISQPKAMAETPAHWPANLSPSANGAGLKVVDSTGKVVGDLLERSIVVVDAGNDLLVGMQVTPEGFLSIPVQLLYEAEDCTGTGYVTNLGGMFPIAIAVTGSTVTYADLTQVQRRFIGSYDFEGDCFLFGTNMFVAPPLTFDLSTLGPWVPPFSVAK